MHVARSFHQFVFVRMSFSIKSEGKCLVDYQFELKALAEQTQGIKQTLTKSAKNT